jgi:hypothetical protein
MRTMIHERVPPAAHGRAFAAYSATRNTAELGALGLGGVLVATLGAQPALLVAGLGPVVAALAALALGPAAATSSRKPVHPATRASNMV